MIKIFVAILSGTVVAGLATYAFLELTGRLGLLTSSGRVTLPVWLFVLQIALVGLLAGGLTQLFLRLLQTEEEKGYEKLAKRMRDLESRE